MQWLTQVVKLNMALFENEPETFFFSVKSLTFVESDLSGYESYLLRGRDGKDGQDGQDGRDGRDGKDGQDGQDGHDGKDGRDGKDGQDGQKGEGRA